MNLKEVVAIAIMYRKEEGGFGLYNEVRGYYETHPDFALMRLKELRKQIEGTGAKFLEAKIARMRVTEEGKKQKGTGLLI